MSWHNTRGREYRQQASTHEQTIRHFSLRLHALSQHLTTTIKGLEETYIRNRYASLLIYRLMFMYFLQRLGLLADDRQYFQHRLQEQQESGGSFYRSVLRPLFSTDELPVHFPRSIANLFHRCEIEQQHPALEIADELFTSLFTLFDEYEWQTDNSASDNGAITPEIIGTIFEQQIHAREMGVYYTPREVTDYIARNTLLPALFTRARIPCSASASLETSLWQTLAHEPLRFIYPATRQGHEHPLPPAIAAGLMDVAQRALWQQHAPAAYALPGETWRKAIARRKRVDEILALLRQDAPATLDRLISWNLDLPALTLEALRACPQADVLDTCYRSLRQLSVLDPTCGTGAFLRAVLPLLQDLYAACLERMEALVAEPSLPALYRHAFQIYLAEAGPPVLRAYTSLQWIIDHNLYGVDLNAEAVEVCRLQLCLKLIAMRPTRELVALSDHFGQHIRVGNSLLGSLAGNSARETQPETDSSQRSLRWDQAFPTPMERGGFDVVIGNPPYVEYKRVRHLYTLDGYTTLETNNLYALTMERAAHLLAPGGRFGMIVPSSATCTDGYRPLQELLLAQQELHVASFSDQRGHLFPIPHPRLCIILYAKNTPTQPENTPVSTPPDSSSPTPVLTRSDNAQGASVPPMRGRVFATPYIKLDAETRTSLFEILSYTEVTSRIRPGLIPRYGSPLELAIDSKLALQERLLGSSLQRKGEYPIYFTRKLSWYVQVTPFIPRILDAQGQVRLPSELKCLRFSELPHARIAFAALNSHLFYWLITTGSDCRNLNMREVRGLPLDLASIQPVLQQELCQLADELERSLLQHARMKPMVFQSQGRLTIQCLYPARSKGLIDEIDRALARHYMFNQQELDFLLHYDEEYR